MTDQTTNANILNDGGINTGGNEAAEIISSSRKFVRKNERIERDISFHASVMQIRHQLRKVRLGKIARPHPGVESVQTEINRVRAIFHGSTRAVPVTGRRQQLRQPRTY